MISDSRLLTSTLFDTQVASMTAAFMSVESSCRPLPVCVRGHPEHAFLGSPFFSPKTAYLRRVQLKRRLKFPPFSGQVVKLQL